MQNKRLTVGLVSSPDALNPLTATTEHSFTILNGIYGLGGVRHPETGALDPWLFESWDLDASAVGTDRPTVVAELRDGIRFTDGEPLTAEDIVFTVEYSRDRTMAGAHGTRQYDAVERVTTPDPDGHRVAFHFSRASNSWRRGVLGYPVLPKHVWTDVEDPSEYDPADSGTPVGAGHLRLVEYTEGERYRLALREQATIWTEAVEWLDSDGPFVDEIEFVVYRSQTALERAIRRGDCDVSRDPVTPDAANRARRDGRRVVRTSDTGWDHFSFNTRRPPLDDPAFRQLLVMLFDREFAVSEVYPDGTDPGSYVTPSAYSSWRPPEPWALDQYEGKAVPSLTFPGEDWQLDPESAGTAREFLRTHERAQYEYQFEEQSQPSGAHDDALLTVDGRSLPALTDGAMTVTVRPPSEDPLRYRLAGHWVTAMEAVGIPTQVQVRPLESLTEQVFQREAFDIFGAGWRNVAAENDHYQRMFSSKGADLDGNSDDFHPNPMGYTGADDLIDRQASIFDPERRRQLVKRLLVEIWRDAPTLVAGYRCRAYPISDRFDGYVHALGGVARPVSWLSVRKNDT